MSKKKKPAKRQQFWEKHHSPKTKPHLLHFLSPLENAVFEHRLKKFTYDFDGVEIVIDDQLCDAIYKASRVHIRHLQSVIRLSVLNLLKRDPVKKRFLMMPIEKHNLPVRLHNALSFHDCKTLAAVAEHGINDLKRMRLVGPDSIAYLIKLFKKNNCGLLFSENA